MTKEQKIMACYGHVDSRSAARMAGSAYMYVYYVFRKNNVIPVRTFTTRSNPAGKLNQIK